MAKVGIKFTPNAIWDWLDYIEPDPNAGRPDLYAICMAFYPEWHHRIKSGQIRSVPRGSVYQVKYADTDPDDDDDLHPSRRCT